MVAKQRTALQLWGRELARAREAKGVSGAELAKAIYVSHSLVGMWELGKRAPKIKDLERGEAVLGTNGYLVRLLTEWVSREVSPEWLDKWLTIEEAATTLLSFQPTVIDGLLQTEDYARAVLRAGRYHLTDVTEMVNSRLERQRILTKDDGAPIFVALMAESILRQKVGDERVMHDQLTHLAEMAQRDNVIMQIVPSAAPAGAGFLSHFMLASFDGSNAVAYVDNQLRGDVIEHPDDVATLRRTFELFRGAALSSQESIELIRRTAGQWKP